MWIFHPTGFFSIVQDRDNKDRFLVRARCREDIEQFTKHLGTIPGDTPTIIETPHADYRFRIFVDKVDAINAIVLLTYDVDYTNFKNAACAADPSKDRKTALMAVWEAMWRFQSRRR